MPGVQVKFAEVIAGDALITFSDGESILYSARLLYSLIKQAKRISSEELDN